MTDQASLTIDYVLCIILFCHMFHVFTLQQCQLPVGFALHRIQHSHEALKTGDQKFHLVSLHELIGCPILVVVAAGTPAAVAAVIVVIVCPRLLLLHLLMLTSEVAAAGTLAAATLNLLLRVAAVLATLKTFRNEGLGEKKCGSGAAHSESSFRRFVVDATANPLARNREGST